MILTTERQQEDRRRSILKARSALSRDLVVLDTETTGLGSQAEIVEISCINRDGRVLLDTLVQPRGAICPEAMGINGLTPEMLQDAPAIGVVMDLLEPVLSGAEVISSYNLAFERRLLHQSVGRDYQLPPSDYRLCIMRAYAAFRGEWNDHHEDYRWHRLADAMRECGTRRQQGTPHGSLQNALGALEVLRHMAAADPDPLAGEQRPEPAATG